MFLGLVGFVVGGCIWTCYPFHAELGVERCSLYSSLPGPLQTGQRAEMWDGGGVILALQSLAPVHLGVDHKKVVRHVSHILSGVSRGRPLELCTDGDLLILVADLIRKRGQDTVQVTEVEGHADDCMVRDGRVRALDKAGNDLAHRAAFVGRRRLLAGIICAGRLCAAACREWYPFVSDLHRFFLAIARVVVNEDGLCGSAPYPTVWDGGAKLERRRVLQALWEFAWVPGTPDLWGHGSVGWLCIHVGAADVAAWPSVGMLVELCAFSW